MRRCTSLAIPTLVATSMFVVFSAGCNSGVESSGPAGGEFNSPAEVAGETSETGETDSTNSPAGDSTSAETRHGVIGFSALTLKNPFFKIIADTITKEGEKHGYDVVVSDAADNVNEQAKHIDNFIAQRVAAIVLNPADRIAIGPAIKKANDAGIPVFTCDLECVADGVEIAGHVGTDNLQGGRLAGEAMIAALGEAGGEVLILHKKAANSCVLRVQGFMEVIAEHNEKHPEREIRIVSELEGNGSHDESFPAAADALQAHPQLAGIFAINDPSALGAWSALNQARLTERVVIVGFDGQIEGKQAIKDGKIYADPIQFPDQIASKTVDKIMKHLNGEVFTPTELIPTKLYGRAEADADPELQ